MEKQIIFFRYPMPFFKEKGCPRSFGEGTADWK